MQTNRTGLIVAAAAVAMVGSAVVNAQMGGMMNGRQHQAATTTEQAAPNADQPPMQQGMHMMMQGRQMMMQAMQQQQSQLKEAVAAMKSAQGDQRIDAIEKVVELLADHHEQMCGRMCQMMDHGMMDHGMTGSQMNQDDTAAK